MFFDECDGGWPVVSIFKGSCDTRRRGGGNAESDYESSWETRLDSQDGYYEENIRMCP